MLPKHYQFKELHKISGIYMLVSGTDVVYIGQASDIHRRLTSHVGYHEKPHDTVLYMQIDDFKDRIAVEKGLIFYYKPEHNVQITSDPLYINTKVLTRYGFDDITDYILMLRKAELEGRLDANHV